MTGETERPAPRLEPENGPARLEMDLVESRVHERLFGAPIREVTIGRFVVLRPAGVGGMGVVFVARDPRLGRDIAIKLVSTGLIGASSSAQARLLAEARTVARLSHPNIVTVLECGKHDGGIYLAMEHIDGETLEAWQPGRTWMAIVAAYVQAGRGLVAAHTAGIVHRDFKPANAMIDRSGHVRVLDFGLAIEHAHEREPSESDGGSSSASTRGGTYSYMAPEQRAGFVASPASDQFALCVSLSRALDAVETGGSTGPGRVPSPGPVPRWLRKVVARGIDADPARRWPAMADLVDALVHGGRRHHRRIVGGGLLATLAASTCAVWGLGGPASAPADDCHGFEATGARAWDDPARQATSQALAGVEQDVAIMLHRGLDEYAEALRVEHAAACNTTDDALASARLQCLERMERELTGTIDRLARADASAVSGVTMAIVELEPPDRCERPDGFDADQDAAVEDLLASARVSLRAGLARDALATAAIACTQLGDVDTVQRARCEIIRGDALVLLGRNDEASGPLEQAYLTAQRHDRSHLAMRAGELAARNAMQLGRFEEARRWLGYVRSDAARLDGPVGRVAAQIIEAELLARDQQYADALVIHDRLRNDGSLAFVGPSRRISTLLRAVLYRGRLGDAEGAARDLDAAAELAASLPRSHALVSAVHATRGQHLQQLGRHEEALASFRITLELATVYRDADDPMGADASGAISDCLLALGRTEEALAVADQNVRHAEQHALHTLVLPRALLARAQIRLALDEASTPTVREGVPDPNGLPALAERDGLAALGLVEARDDGDEIAAGAHVLVANTQRAQGRLDEARTHAELAQAEFARILGPDHPETLGLSLVIATIESDRGDFGRAIELATRARVGFEAALGSDHPHVAHACMNLGIDLEHAGRIDEAIEAFECARTKWAAAFGDEHPDTRDAAEAAARVRAARGA